MILRRSRSLTVRERDTLVVITIACLLVAPWDARELIGVATLFAMVGVMVLRDLTLPLARWRVFAAFLVLPLGGVTLQGVVA